MTATRQHADLLVLGHSPEAALSAVLLAKRGASVVWAGAPGAGIDKLGPVQVFRAPSLFAAMAHLPALRSALDEAGLAGELEKLSSPVKLQVLSAAARDDAPGCAAPEGLDEQEAPSFGLFAMGRWRKQRDRRLAARVAPAGEAGRVLALLGRVVGCTDHARRILAAPAWLPGGLDTLTQLLWKRFAALSARTVAHGLASDVTSCSFGWREVSLVLGSGEQLGARALVLGVDDEELERLSSAQKLVKKVVSSDALPLWRQSFAVKARGLPVALGPVALVEGEPPLLIERHPGDDGVDALSVFWREASKPDAAALQQMKARLLALLPFFDRHVVAATEPVRVRFHDVVEVERTPRPARRVLWARTPALSLSGLDGGALLAEGLSRLAVRLAPRKDVGAENAPSTR